MEERLKSNDESLSDQATLAPNSLETNPVPEDQAQNDQETENKKDVSDVLSQTTLNASKDISIMLELDQEPPETLTDKLSEGIIRDAVKADIPLSKKEKKRFKEQVKQLFNRGKLSDETRDQLEIPSLDPKEFIDVVKHIHEVYVPKESIPRLLALGTIVNLCNITSKTAEKMMSKQKSEGSSSAATADAVVSILDQKSKKSQWQIDKEQITSKGLDVIASFLANENMTDALKGNKGFMNTLKQAFKKDGKWKLPALYAITRIPMAKLKTHALNEFEKELHKINKGINARIAQSIVMRDYEFSPEKPPYQIGIAMDRGRSGINSMLRWTYLELIPTGVVILNSVNPMLYSQKSNAFLNAVRMITAYYGEFDRINKTKPFEGQKEAINYRLDMNRHLIMQDLETVKTSPDQAKTIQELTDAMNRETSYRFNDTPQKRPMFFQQEDAFTKGFMYTSGLINVMEKMFKPKRIKADQTASSLPQTSKLKFKDDLKNMIKLRYNEDDKRIYDSIIDTMEFLFRRFSDPKNTHDYLDKKIQQKYTAKPAKSDVIPYQDEAYYDNISYPNQSYTRRQEYENLPRLDQPKVSRQEIVSEMMKDMFIAYRSLKYAYATGMKEQSDAVGKAQILFGLTHFHLPAMVQCIKDMEEVLVPPDPEDAPDGAKEQARISVKDLPNFDIHIRNLTFKDILKDISLDIPQGSFVTIKGPSGIGKTTLMRHILGLYKAEPGIVTYGGVDLQNIKQFSQDSIYSAIAYAKQEPEYFTWMTLRDNLKLWMHDDISDEQINQVLKNLYLDKFVGRLDEYFGRFSGGEKRRIGLARALLKNPNILFLDEPTSNLDEDSSRQVLDILKTLHENNPSMTIVSITHDKDFEHIADRIIDFRNLNGKTQKESMPDAAVYVGIGKP